MRAKFALARRTTRPKAASYATAHGEDTRTTREDVRPLDAEILQC
jgi:hypothetical protein